MVRWGSSAAMGDYETSDDESERPTALEADIDGGSSVSSIATDHADNVSIDTIESDFDSSDDEANIHFGRGRRSAEEREIALERNSLRRQASNDLLAAMHASTKSIVKDGEQATSREPLRRAPPRTKSGDGLRAGREPVRRAPPRTKSGDGLGGSEQPPRRRPPARTKSGDALRGSDTPKNRRGTKLGEPPESEDFIVSLRLDGDHDDQTGMSPAGRQRRKSREEKEEALGRNAMRRQASSEMLEAMRNATRNCPSRTKSSSGDGGEKEPRRRPPPRTKSGDGLGGSDRPEPQRRPPARTKSGDGLGGSSRDNR